MPKPSQAFIITSADAALLLALNRFHYLTAAQVSRLLYPQTNDENRYSQRRLARLVAAGYVLRLRALATPRFGSAPHVFTLARRGRQYLEALGIATAAYYRPSEEEAKARNNPYMEHTLAAVDVLLAVDLLCSILPVTCPVLLCERELRRHAVRVDVPPHPGNPSAPRRVAVVPDGWFQLSVEGGTPLSISLELDRGTEEQKYWRRKVQALAAWAEGPYRKAFQTDNLTIAVVTPTDTRRDQLRGWTSRELAERALTHLSDIFLFTSADPVTTPPVALFFDPLWHPPGTAAPVPLIEKAPVPAVAAPRPGPPSCEAGQRQEAVVLNL